MTCCHEKYFQYRLLVFSQVKYLLNFRNLFNIGTLIFYFSSNNFWLFIDLIIHKQILLVYFPQLPTVFKFSIPPPLRSQISNPISCVYGLYMTRNVSTKQGCPCQCCPSDPMNIWVIYICMLIDSALFSFLCEISFKEKICMTGILCMNFDMHNTGIMKHALSIMEHDISIIMHIWQYD